MMLHFTSKHMVRTVMILFLSSAVILGLVACGSGTSSQTGTSATPAGGAFEKEIFNINATKVIPTSIARKITLDGDVKAADIATVTPDVAGKLASLLVEEGEKVRKGQDIAQVDPSRPGQDFLLSPVTAPISGTISSIYIKTGNPVLPSSIIAEISDNSRIQIELFVPERFVNDIKPGKKGELTLVSFPGEIFPLTTTTTSNVLSTLTHTMKISMEFDNTDSRIKSGMFGTVELELERVDSVPTVRRDHIIQRFFEGKNNNGVFLVKEEEENFVSRFVAIELGIEDKDYYEVKKGLQENDIIVTTGQDSLVDGSYVRVLSTN